MAAIRADPLILEVHITIKATVDASHADVVTRLAALNGISWHFLEATIGAFDEDYKVFSQRARAYLNSRASKLVPGEAQVTHHYEEGTHDVEASPSSMSKEPIIIDISNDEEETMGSTEVYNQGPVLRGFDPLFDPFCIWGNELSMNIIQVKKLRKIVRMNKLVTKNNKIFVCTMKKKSIHYKMAFLKQFTDDYLSNHTYGLEARKVFIQHPWYNLEVSLKRMKDGRSIIPRHWPKVAKTFNINEGSMFTFRFSSFPDEIYLSIYRL
ncbi:casein kinase i isoform delta-like protein [Hordeum vulgare]|nr:casein kinase i isoform delta-like protein [Hordeum vulgare]